MPRKRHAPDTLLARILGGLEQQPQEADPAVPLRLPPIRDALQCLLTIGPLWSPEAQAGQTLDDDELLIVRAEILQFLRSLVRQAAQRGAGPYGLTLSDGPITITAMATPRGRVGVQVTSPRPRDVAILQTVLLLQLVGIEAVRPCAAADCARIFVKTYRREYCSRQCQNRTHARATRVAARRARAQRRRRRVS